MAFFYFKIWIVAVETIEGGKLFKVGNYSRKYGKDEESGKQMKHLIANFWFSSSFIKVTKQFSPTDNLYRAQSFSQCL